ncbi:MULTISPECIES: ABC transporter ATP-binding protein [unclassified Variovorax]|jgi:urea transport system ATP-binding protein|uniref:ABC transporter ATP-binding protein n=1 Tax=unclassified Variovorax TaxID=663243 RepID=UPI0008EE704D|nr:MULTISPECIES: ABC transporter ATP-binding protein [unclassified Variovorax]TAJ56528.1 MAG: ABC transporter ATP-binding protein [Variovorax sp.]SFO25526.1 amino acid/amide ABC transporter ATP-binding protein 2, HAAT family [Variovorax sp. PDC80]
MNTTETVLEIRGLQAGYGATPILQGVDLTVGKGEIVALIGRNGVGKTTTMRCLMGLLRTRGGGIRFLGRDIETLTSDARARLGIGYVPQGREVFPRMTVAENLMVGELIGGPRGRKQPELVYQYFPRLAERRDQLAGTMSGGEQQQLAIGRALVGNPALMLLDEPSEGIQPSIVQLICDVLRAIRRDLGTTILFVEQNLDTILDVGERAYVMEKGRIVGRIEPGAMNAQAVREHLSL